MKGHIQRECQVRKHEEFGKRRDSHYSGYTRTYIGRVDESEKDMALDDVLYSKEAEVKLSVSQLTDSGSTVIFNKESVLLVDEGKLKLHDDEQKKIGNRRNNLYYLCGEDDVLIDSGGWVDIYAMIKSMDDVDIWADDGVYIDAPLTADDERADP